MGHDPFGERILRTLRAERLDVSNVTPSRSRSDGLLVRNCFAWREPDVFYYRKDTAFLSESLAVAESVKFQPGDIFFTTGITLALGPRVVRRAQNSCDGPTLKKCRCILMRFPQQAMDSRSLPRMPDTAAAEHPYAFRRSRGGRILTGATKVADIAKKMPPAGVQEISSRTAQKAHGNSARARLRCMARPSRSRRSIPSARETRLTPVSSPPVGRSFPPLTLRTANAMGAMACMGQGDWESMPTRSELGSFVLGETQARR